MVFAGAQFQIPGAMGMILSGMLLRNVGGGLAIAGLKASLSKQIRGAALAIIFLRSGLEIDLDVRALHCVRRTPLAFRRNTASGLPAAHYKRCNCRC